jgi:O-antigen ligase
MLAGAATCIIVPTMLFTFSRGAWVAAAVGFVAMISLDSRRVRLVATFGATAIPVAMLVGLGVTSAGLTDIDATVAHQAHDGRPYAIAVVVLAAAAAVLVELVHAALLRLDPGARAERRLAIAAAIVAVLVVVAALAAAGGPVRAVERGRSALSVAYTGKQQNLRDRFVSLANNGRIAHWRVALRDARDHPLVGTGAGTYEETWYRLRSDDLSVRDAHSMYLEVLAELGPFGLFLLLLALAVPAVGLVRSRSGIHVPAAAGAFAAYVVHAGIDWDWEVVCLTSIAILLGTSGLLPLGARARVVVLSRTARVGFVAVAVAAAIFAFVSYAGNRELAASRRALAQGNPTAAASDARRATRLLWWSVEPWIALGDAQSSGQDVPGARVSYTRAADKDPGNWRVWVVLSDVTSGAAHRRALREVHALNPRYDPTNAGG